MVAANFQVVAVEGRNLHDEKDLLKELGGALRFPDYYGGNWDSFIDCAGDMANRDDPIAVIWTEANTLLNRDVHAFVRAVYYLLSVADNLGTLEPPFQMELFLVSDRNEFRNVASG